MRMLASMRGSDVFEWYVSVQCTLEKRLPSSETLQLPLMRSSRSYIDDAELIKPRSEDHLHDLQDLLWLIHIEGLLPQHDSRLDATDLPKSDSAERF